MRLEAMWPGSMKGYIEAAVVIVASTDPASSLHISLEVTITEKSLSLDKQPHRIITDERSPENEKIVQRFLV